MEKNNEFLEKLVHINRITKVVKGGRRFGFAALVVVGNQKGSVGIGQGKSKQVPDAIKKATEVAKRNLVKIPLKDGRTLHHDVKGKNGSGKSTLLNVIGLLESPKKGRVLISNIDCTKLKPEQQSFVRKEIIGFIFQNYQLHYELYSSLSLYY